MSELRQLRLELLALADDIENRKLLHLQAVVARLYELCPEEVEARRKLRAAESLSDLLLLVGFKIPYYRIMVWTPENQSAAEVWAASSHLAASDNDVEVPDRPGFLVNYTEENQNRDSHNCHFCGEYVLNGYEGNGNRHWLSDCRPDLVQHEEDPTICTWGYLLLPENADLSAQPDRSPKTCYAYQNRDYPPKTSLNDPARWTDEHKHFDTDGPM